MIELRPKANRNVPRLARVAPAKLSPCAYFLVLTLMIAALMAWLGDRPESHSQAYIGPGAGIALIGSFLTMLGAMLLAFGVMVTWPIRRLLRFVRGQKAFRDARVKRVVVLGLDGLEPTITEKLLNEGALPNLAKLRAMGCYLRLGTTTPPLSPVAWSSFSTGTNPGKHNIFDFITRNPATYKPMISSVRIREPKRVLRLGPFVIPLSKPSVTALRKSKPFWNVLGEAGIFSAVLRVPITFPPDRFRGVQLSAMCVPDLRGTQGMFSYYVEQGEAGLTTDGDVGGDRIRVERNGRGVSSFIRGPVNSLRSDRSELRTPFRVVPTGKANGGAILHINGNKHRLPINDFSDWIRVSFSAAPGVKVRGVARFFLKRVEKPFEMYCTPVQIDPDKPVMPISHPTVYSSYLARSHGPFATLGLAEDTWSLSERLMGEDAFLQQAYDIHDERERMFFDSLQKVSRGLVVCVFDAPDRIQHMFWRFTEDDHPALRGMENRHADTIHEMYRKMDALVGRTMDELELGANAEEDKNPAENADDGTALIVMSDHGFKSFQRGVDLNAWLRDNGYLKLKDDAAVSRGIYLADMDWSQTRAYAIGLAGMFINQEGREAQGIVEPGAATKQLVQELASRLTGLKDPERDEVAIHEAVPRGKVYKGPYTRAAPDLIMGYRAGYRVSWDAAVGKCGPVVFSDNTKAWSGDHCIHPELVPGVLFSNIKLNGQNANIIDVAPTALELFGVEKPAYMDGTSLLREEVAP